MSGKVGAIHRNGACVVTSTNPDAVQHTDVIVGGKILLQMSDCAENTIHPGFSISLGVKTVEETKTRFDNLSAEGTVTIPLAPSFFSPTFGMLTDKFGVNWIITAAA